MACPVNGARSRKVGTLTVKSLVRKLPFRMAETQYYFCEAANCEVVYFPWDAEAPAFSREDLLVRGSAKDAGPPKRICYCFGVSREDIEREVAERGRSALAEQIGREVKAGRCACEVKNPSGRCCLGEITRTVNELVKARIQD
jgi:bacterioferritin-associated ferredoxin